jgi:hypothetical protein
MSDQKSECPNCGVIIEFPEEMVGQVAECPACNTKTYLVAEPSESKPPTLSAPIPPVIPSQPPVQMTPAQAFIERKSSFIGVGCLVQGLGLLGLAAFPFFPFSTIVGILLLIVGGRMAILHVCSQCRGEVASNAQLCQHCRATFVR